jgi:hypothetical protein
VQIVLAKTHLLEISQLYIHILSCLPFSFPLSFPPSHPSSRYLPVFLSFVFHSFYCPSLVAVVVVTMVAVGGGGRSNSCDGSGW